MSDQIDLDIKLFEAPERDFKAHLEVPDNDRLILSGKFGMGKTSFLKHMFGDNGRMSIGKNTYEVFHLFPVSYSISSNKDIMEIIKYDIIVEFLMKTDMPVYEQGIDTKYIFLRDHYKSLIPLLLTAIPVVGKKLSDVYDKLDKLGKDYKAHNKEVNKIANEAETLLGYIDECSEKKGTNEERDVITQVINNILQRNKTDEDGITETENILIIDDLDRLDPEHIFRILNVFGAHFDQQRFAKSPNKNKFGFDKVILVCDINNIRRIFHSKYGQRVDFTGYIDKFYSNEIFYYQSGEQVEFFLNRTFWSKTIYRRSNHYLFRSVLDPYSETLIVILTLLVVKEQLSIRKILSVPEHISTPTEIRIGDRDIMLDEEPSVLLILSLIKVIGSASETKAVFAHLQELNVPLKHEFTHLAPILFLISTEKFFGENIVGMQDTSDPNYPKVWVEKFSNPPSSKFSYKVKVGGSVPISFTNKQIYQHLFVAIDYLVEAGLVE